MTTTRADEFIPRTEVEALSIGYFTRLMARDMEAFAELWHDDAVQYIPFLAEGFGRFVTEAFVGKAKIVEHYTIAFKNRRDHVFWVDDSHLTQDPQCVIIEAHARSLVGETGRVYENSYVCIFKAAEGKLIELREYVNPLKFIQAFEGGFDEHR